MKTFFTVLLSTACWCLGSDQTETLSPIHGAGHVPFSLQIRHVNAGTMPRPTLHSYVGAHQGGLWLMLGGRTNGLHGMTGQNGFPTASANSDVWAVDSAGNQSWSRPLSEFGLSADFVDFLSATNHNFVQSGGFLYVAGGYGWSRSTGDYVTFSYFARIDIAALLRWVKREAGSPAPGGSVQTIQNPLFQVTGGALKMAGKDFLLVFGQNYPGRYRPNFNGTYTRQVRRFALLPGAALQLDPSSIYQSPPADDFRRRDLNVVTALQRMPDGLLRQDTLALAGVFTPTNGVWTVPVTISPEGVPTQPDPLAATTFRQGLHHYHSAKITLFNRVSGDNFILQFGGLSLQYKDPASALWVKDSQVPFVHHVSCVVRNPDGVLHQVLLPAEFPALTSAAGARLFFGTNAEFFPATSTPMLREDVIDLTSVKEPIVAGYIYGGLVSDAPNRGTTHAGGEIFEVSIAPVIASVKPLEIARAPSGQVTLTWQAAPGQAVLMERSADLHSWQEIWPAPAASPFLLQPTAGPRQFFRMLQAPRILPPA